MSAKFAPLSPRKLVKFEFWLTTHGAEILAPTNPYEVVRFKAGDETHVIYRKENGTLNAVNGSADILLAFMTGKAWKAPLKRRTHGSPIGKRYDAIVRRDGPTCFYCGLDVSMHEATTEHLLSRSLGGPNHLANLALAHQKCNSSAGNLSVVEKVRLRDHMRKQSQCS